MNIVFARKCASARKDALQRGESGAALALFFTTKMQSSPFGQLGDECVHYLNKRSAHDAVVAKTVASLHRAILYLEPAGHASTRQELSAFRALSFSVHQALIVLLCTATMLDGGRVPAAAWALHTLCDLYMPSENEFALLFQYTRMNALYNYAMVFSLPNEFFDILRICCNNFIDSGPYNGQCIGGAQMPEIPTQHECATFLRNRAAEREHISELLRMKSLADFCIAENLSEEPGVVCMHQRMFDLCVSVGGGGAQQHPWTFECGDDLKSLHGDSARCLRAIAKLVVCALRSECEPHMRHWIIVQAARTINLFKYAQLFDDVGCKRSEAYFEMCCICDALYSVGECSADEFEIIHRAIDNLTDMDFG